MCISFLAFWLCLGNKIEESVVFKLRLVKILLLEFWCCSSSRIVNIMIRLSSTLSIQPSHTVCLGQPHSSYRTLECFRVLSSVRHINSSDLDIQLRMACSKNNLSKVVCMFCKLFYGSVHHEMLVKDSMALGRRNHIYLEETLEKCDSTALIFLPTGSNLCQLAQGFTVVPTHPHTQTMA